MAKTKVFDQFQEEYDNWFLKNDKIFASEVAAIKPFIKNGTATLEVGVGSGVFAEALNIKTGIDPSSVMCDAARARGIEVVTGVGEQLPFADNKFEAVLLTTAICFLDDLEKTFREIYRVIIARGSVVVAFVDKNSPLGQKYFHSKTKTKFYEQATFYSASEVMKILTEIGFKLGRVHQTVFGNMSDIDVVQSYTEGYGDGGFVVIEALK